MLREAAVRCARGRVLVVAWPNRIARSGTVAHIARQPQSKMCGAATRPPRSDRIRSALRSGQLTRLARAPMNVWAGHGSGRSCHGCGDPISEREVEYETDMAGRPIRLHADCFRVWREE